MDASDRLAAYLKTNPGIAGKVVDLCPEKDKLYHFNFTASNPLLNAAVFSDTEAFSNWINDELSSHACRYGIGGYMENRTIYARSDHFSAGNEEPRRLHLGVDIWAKADTPVYSPLPGTVHSFADNNNFGDYGPTIILQHDLDGLQLFTLYGHLDRNSLKELAIGQIIHKDQLIARFGNRKENGQWPPHLHFQLIFDLQGRVGDYPGVCRLSEKEDYLLNILDPQLLLNFPKAVNDPA